MVAHPRHLWLMMFKKEFLYIYSHIKVQKAHFEMYVTEMSVTEMSVTIKYQSEAVFI